MRKVQTGAEGCEGSGSCILSHFGNSTVSPSWSGNGVRRRYILQEGGVEHALSVLGDETDQEINSLPETSREKVEVIQRGSSGVMRAWMRGLSSRSWFIRQ